MRSPMHNQLRPFFSFSSGQWKTTDIIFFLKNILRASNQVTDLFFLFLHSLTYHISKWEGL